MNASYSILAAFLWPQLFAAGASAASIPVIIHLLARRRFKRIRWAALEFLIDAEKRNRRRIRMEEWILLALRCLAMLLIALIVSRPFLRPEGLASLMGSTGRVERVFILDDSFSMAYRGPEGTSFERATAAARRLIEGARQESPDDTVSILRTSALAEPVVAGAYLDDTGVEGLLLRLDGMSPSEGTYDLAAAVDAVLRLLDDQSGHTGAAVYFISDFQRTDWLHSAGADAALPPAHPLARLAAWGGDERELHLVLVGVGDADAANVSISGLALASGQPVASAAARLRVNVANHTDDRIEQLPIETSVGPAPQPVRTIDAVGARQSAVVEIGIEFTRPGYEAIVASVPDDGLPLDNRRHMTVDVASAVRILLVNGEPATESYTDEVHLLATALRPDGDVFSGNHVVMVDESGFERASLAEYHAVVLANVYRVSEPQVEALERYVSGGGGLIVYLGDQVDPGLYNGALYRAGEGLLPVRLDDVVHAPEGGVALEVVDRLHPVFSGLGREGDPLGVARIRFQQYYECRLPEAEDELDAEGLEGAVGSDVRGRRAIVTAVFADDQRRPAIIERAFGRGRVVVLATSADKEWNNWADHPTYLPVAVELVSYVARSALRGDGVRVGEPIVMEVDPARFAADALVRSPAYPADPETSVAAVASDDGVGLTLRWEHTAQSGVYQILLRTPEGGEVPRLVAVNVSPEESDLSTALPDELRDAIDVPFEYIDGLEALGGAEGAARTEFWSTFLVLALAVLMMEQGLAWWFGRRR